MLDIVDWRVRVTALYEQVRADPEPESGHATWREGRDALFRTHPESPLKADDPLRDTGLPTWPYDPSLRWELEVLPPAEDAIDPDERVVDGGGDGDVTMRRVGRVELPIGGSLDVWRLHQYAGGLFVPLKDGTCGQDGGSYGAGRYLLDTAKGSWLGGTDGRLLLDLNFAYHPSCRYNDRWRCPLASPGNTITERVEAGERMA